MNPVVIVGNMLFRYVGRQQVEIAEIDGWTHPDDIENFRLNGWN